MFRTCNLSQVCSLLVDKTSGGQLGVESMAKDLSETPLVVVKALLGFVVNGANVDHNVAGLENGGIAAAL